MAEPVTTSKDTVRTPRSAAIAGILFALLLGVALVLVRLAVPSDPGAAPDWLESGWRKDAVVIALNLVPFAGLAFLWFVGVVRDRIGAAEDRLFATVFLGTGLLFVAMLFVAGAVAGGLIEAESPDRVASVSPEVWHFGRRTTFLVLTVFGMRMAGAFTIVTTTIGLRLGILRRWLAVLGGIIGVLLLVAVESFAWVELLFPVWVLLVSVRLLIRSKHLSDAQVPA